MSKGQDIRIPSLPASRSLFYRLVYGPVRLLRRAGEYLAYTQNPS